MTEKTDEGVVVVIGTGHVGINLARTLTEQGRKVRILAYDKAMVPAIISNEVPKAEVCLGDILYPDSLEGVFRGAGTVYLAAAMISLGKEGWGKMYGVNVTGVKNVSEAAIKQGVRKVIFFSSIHAIKQEPVDKVLDETWELLPAPGNRTYGESKAEGERMAMSYLQKGGFSGCVLSPTGIIGPLDHMPSEFGEVLLTMARGKMPGLIKGAGMDWVDVRDVTKAAIAAEQSDGNGEKYLLAGGYQPLEETAAIVARVAKVEPPGMYISYKLARLVAPAALGWARLTGRRASFTPYSLEALAGNKHISTEKAHEALGFEPRPHEETVTDAVEWLLGNFSQK